MITTQEPKKKGKGTAQDEEHPASGRHRRGREMGAQKISFYVFVSRFEMSARKVHLLDERKKLSRNLVMKSNCDICLGVDVTTIAYDETTREYELVGINVDTQQSTIVRTKSV